MSELFELREKLNLTQEELAEKSGISVRTIQRIEAGLQPKGYTLKALAKALEINEYKLIVKSEINVTMLKLINLSSLPFTLLPPLNIVLPLIIMFARKQFNSVTKQIVSIQILWTILSSIIFMISVLMKSKLQLGSRFILVIMIMLIVSNVFIILRNAAGIDKNKKLHIRLSFNLI